MAKKFETLIAHWPPERRARVEELVRRDLEEIERQEREAQDDPERDGTVPRPED